MESPSVVVLGGGLSGVATAFTLAESGIRDITLIERGSALGGLAGSFERNGYFYPLGYHHILHRDRTLLFFLDRLGALPQVRWRRIRMIFSVNGARHHMDTPLGFLRFPMAMTDKLRFVRLMLRAFHKNDWSDWLDRSASELVDRWAGPGVRRALFEGLTQLKFELPCDEVSGAWLGARLHFREGSAPLGYIPHTNWTKVLCDGVTKLLATQGVRLRLRSPITRLHAQGDRIREVELASGERVGGDLFVSTLPTEVYLGLMEDRTPHLASIRYTALLSTICATRQVIFPPSYWMVMPPHERAAGGIFQLNALNPTIGAPGDTTINFVTHLQSRERPFFKRSDEELLAAYMADFRTVFGLELKPFWTHIARIPMYSPIFHRRYHNPPIHSATWRNLYFAGNYRTFPSVASTGTALASGIEAGQAILRDHGRVTGLPGAVAAFRLSSMPRA